MILDSNSLKRLYTLASSIIVGHAFNIYCIDPSTLPKALIICCITPSVTAPATIAGAKKTYADSTFACKYAILPILKYRYLISVSYTHLRAHETS